MIQLEKTSDHKSIKDFEKKIEKICQYITKTCKPYNYTAYRFLYFIQTQDMF